MTPLDRLVRELLFRFPPIFRTRWDVLRHLFLVIGNGYEWVDGQLVAVVDREEFDEQQAREVFFRDLEGLEEIGGDPRGDRLRRARRQFQLDHIDDLVYEDSGLGLTALDMTQVSERSSHAFTVPPDVEESFRAGALEVLFVVRRAAEYMGARFGQRGVDLAAETQARIDALRVQR